ncbi:MAG: alpha/beta hydrolase [Caulobacteraceae bacterium]|nr:alpha/beta hydrolase [Caulobacteraceae bacterium]
MTNAGWTHHRMVLSEVDMHYVTAGDPAAETLVLVHGFPKSWFEWRRMIPLLAPRFRIIAPDLRGSGDSSKPSGGFDKRTMSRDIVELLDRLGLGDVHVAGRDWGAPTALGLALHWKRAKSLTYIENSVPGFGLEDAIRPVPPKTGAGEDVFFQKSGINHFTFHLMPDIAEFLIQGRERPYFTWFLTRLAYNVGAIDAETIDECVRCLSAPGALRATLGYSRALWQDSADIRAAVEKGRLSLPVLALGGDHGANLRPAESLRRIADDVEGDVIPECGHWASEEQPEWIASRVLSFLAKHQAG